MQKSSLISLIATVAPLVLFLGLSLQLLLPSGSIIAGGDFYQLTSYSFNLDRYAYAWFQQIGQGVSNSLVVTYPYYYFLSLIERYFGSNTIAFFQLFLFLTLAYFSFFLSLKLLIKEKTIGFYIYPSLIYALNNFVITIFSYPWGLTHHFLIYLFLPLIIVTFIRVFTLHKERMKSIAIFMIVIISCIPAINNPSYIAVIYLMQLVIFLALLKNSHRKHMLSNIFTFTFLIFIQFMIFIWILLPSIITVLEKPMNSFTTSQALGGENYLESWITGTSSNFFNILTLTLDETRYPFLLKPIDVTQLLSVAVIFVMLVYLITLNHKIPVAKRDRYSYLNIFSWSLIVICFLAVRLYPPFDSILKVIYLSPLFIFFRSPEKLLLVVSMLYTFVIALLLSNLKVIPRVMWVLLSVLLIPWLLQIPREMLAADFGKYANTRDRTYSYTISIPEEYLSLSSKLNHQPSRGAILSMPYSIVNSINWSNYPTWKFVGHDILHQLFIARFISANVFDHPVLEEVSTFKNLLKDNVSTQDVLALINNFGGEYIIWHHDIDPLWQSRSKGIENVLNQMVEQGNLSIDDQNQYFTLYRVPTGLIRPIISISDGTAIYTKINPVMYQLNVSPASSASKITFLQTFSNSWRLFKLSGTHQFDCAKSIEYKSYNTVECLKQQSENYARMILIFISHPAEAEHQLCEGYANCWTVTQSYDASNDDSYIIFNTDQLLVLGLIMTSIIIFIAAVFTVTFESRIIFKRK